MKCNRKYLLTTCIAFTIISCELIVDVDVPLDEKRLVLNCILNTDSTWRVDIHEEKHILESTNFFNRVTNANVSITDDAGNVVASLEYDDFGRYRADGYPEPGKTYYVSASAPGYPTATGMAKVPDLVSFVSIVWDSVNLRPPGEFSPPGYPVEVTFNDQGGETNFYDVRLYVEQIVTFGGPNGMRTDTIISKSFLMSDDPVFDHDRGGYGLIADTFFDGEQRTIKYFTYHGGSNLLRVWMVFTSFNEDYYKYYTTRQLQQEVGFDPFAQPVKVYNNISGGLGVCAGMTSIGVEWDRR